MLRRARFVVLSLVVVGGGAIGACSGDSDAVDGPATATPEVSAATTAPTSVTSQPPVGQPEGFTTAAAEITLADGTLCELCLWVADTADERTRGLMQVTNLGAADGMAFVFEEPTDGAFWMRDTPMPLSIAYFDAAGAFVSSVDMDPCLGGGDCPRYSAAGPYLHAVEMPLGHLQQLGVGPESTFRLLDAPCRSRR